MFTTYRNVSFIANTVTGLEVDGSVIYIMTTGQSYTVQYNTNQEALDDLGNLTSVINGAVSNGNTNQKEPEARTGTKSEKVQDGIQATWDRLHSFLGSNKKTASEKIQDAILSQAFGTASKAVEELLNSKDELISRAQGWVNDLEKALETEVEKKPMATRNEPKSTSPEPTAATAATAPSEPVQQAVKPEVKAAASKTACFDNVQRATSIIDTDGIFTSYTAPSESTIDAKKLTAEQFKVLFGTPDEPVIGDMSERQLREFISEFVEGALTNERVQQLFQNIKDNFGESEAEGAIEGYKNLILTISLQNVEMTLSQIISQYFS